MWKLVIHQIKKYDTFETEQTVTFESEHLEILLIQINNLTKLDTSTKTWYEIKEVEE